MMHGSFSPALSNLAVLFLLIIASFLSSFRRYAV